jgi:serine/threonine-protein kinase
VAAFSHQDLLVGVLAVEVALLPPDDLPLALEEWGRDRSRSLAEVLARRLSLPATVRDRLQGLAAAHLACLWDDPELCRRRAELSPACAGDQARCLTPSGDMEAKTVPLSPAVDLAVPEAPALSQPLAGTCSYHRVALHARGGLGQVSLARDEALGRLVALKEIQPGRADDPTSRQSFLFEALVTGNLEHPGIVPVYAMGRAADGRPFYAMRFIRGQSLDEAIRRFHAEDTESRPAGERTLALRGLLRRFVDVCNAVQYAHSHGVVHRDLKPANVMLGDFGETLVIDWGLALNRRMKEAGAQTKEDADRDPSSLIPPSSFLLPPSRMGTPAYSSPEQAHGRHDEVGPRSDVYSLGVSLYQLLTGHKPFTAPTLETLLDKVSRGEYPPASQVKPGVPRPLEAVCRKAMAVRAEDRYESAQALAEEVERWLADEPLRAHREPVTVRLRRWGRRHRTLVTTAVALLLASVVALALGLGAVQREKLQTQRQRDRALDAEKQARDSLEATREAEKLARTHLAAATRAEQRARANLEQAEANLQLARKAVDECFGVAREHPLLQAPNVMKVRRLLLEKTLPFYKNFRSRHPDDPALASEQADCLFRVAYITTEIGNKSDALARYQQVLEVLGKLARQHPRDRNYQFLLAHTWNNVGILHRDAGKPGEALRCYTQARNIQRELVKAHPGEPGYQGDLGVTLRNLGYLHHEAGRDEQARRCYDQARNIQVKLVKEQPGVYRYRAELAITWSNLGLLHQKAGKFEEAANSHEQARELLLALVKEQPEVTLYRDVLSRTWNNLGIAQHYLRQYPQALDSFTRARDLGVALAVGNPESNQHRAELAGTWVNLGQLQTVTNRHTAALDSLNRAIALLADARRREPANPTWRLFQRNAHGSRAHLLGLMGRHRQAVADWDVAARLESEAGWRGTARLQRAVALAHAGEPMRAVAEAEQLSRAPSPTGAMLYDLACVVALSAAAVSRDPRCPLPQREKCAEVWSHQALDLLRRAQRAGFFEQSRWIEHMKKDSDLDFLRSRDDFQRWLESLPAPGKAP